MGIPVLRTKRQNNVRNIKTTPNKFFSSSHYLKLNLIICFHYRQFLSIKQNTRKYFIGAFLYADCGVSNHSDVMTEVFLRTYTYIIQTHIHTNMGKLALSLDLFSDHSGPKRVTEIRLVCVQHWTYFNPRLLVWDRIDVASAIRLVQAIWRSTWPG